MPRSGHMGPRWIRAEGDPPGFVKDGQTGTYCIRRAYSPGPGQPLKQVVRSLGTKSKAEALKLYDIKAAQVRLTIEGTRVAEGPTKQPTLKEEVSYWRAFLASGSDDADASYSAEIERKLGPELGADPDEPDRPTYAPGREAATLEFVQLVDGRQVPVDFLVDDFVRANPISMRYVSRIKLAVRQLAEFLRERPKGNAISAVDRRTASDFIVHLVKTESSVTTAKSKRSALSSYWDWLVSREDAKENIWTGHKMPRLPGKTDVREYTRDEMLALLKGTDQQPMADFIRLGALTGARAQDIGGLQVRDCVDGWFVVRKGKTEAAKRRLPIHPDLKAIVERRCADKKPEDFLFHDLPKSGGKGRGRHEKMGERFTTYRRSVGVADEREDGRTRIDYHSFRRWFITEAVRHSGHPEWVVSEIVGHSTGKQSMTIGTYFGGSLDERLEEVVKSVKLPAPANS